MTAPDPISQRPSDAPPELDPQVRRRANMSLLKYGGARLGLFVVLTIVIQLFALLIDAPVPLVMSALLALIVAFPLSMLVFKGMRLEANRSVAAWNAQRRARKEWVKRELGNR